MPSTPLPRRIVAATAGLACVAALSTVAPPASAVPVDQRPPHDQLRHDQLRAARPSQDQLSHDQLLDRGKVLGVTSLGRWSAAELRQKLRAADYPTSAVHYAVSAYRVVYRTIDFHGRPTHASGLITLPDRDQKTLQPVVFAHGTTPTKAEAPSVGTGGYHQAAALSFAGAGFASVAPDYLGLGTGAGRPVYLDGRTEVSATLDLLQASRSLVRWFDHDLDHEVYVSGFSQGAHAALVVSRALQQGQARPFRLGAVAPISGAYDLGGSELPAMINGEVNPKLATLYVGYLLTSWNRIHGLYSTPKEIFRQPYAAVVEHLYDGTHPSQEIFEAMPDRPEELLTERGLRLLTEPTGTFAAAVAAYDTACTGWQPSAPIRLYYTLGDDEAVNANTTACRDRFAASGVRPAAIDLGVGGHTASGAQGVAAAAHWFAVLRND